METFKVIIISLVFISKVSPKWTFSTSYSTGCIQYSTKFTLDGTKYVTASDNGNIYGYAIDSTGSS